jgi:hypothetical protein
MRVARHCFVSNRFVHISPALQISPDIEVPSYEGQFREFIEPSINAWRRKRNQGRLFRCQRLDANGATAYIVFVVASCWAGVVIAIIALT